MIHWAVSCLCKKYTSELNDLLICFIQTLAQTLRNPLKGTTVWTPAKQRCLQTAPLLRQKAGQYFHSCCTETSQVTWFLTQRKRHYETFSEMVRCLSYMPWCHYTRPTVLVHVQTCIMITCASACVYKIPALKMSQQQLCWKALKKMKESVRSYCSSLSRGKLTVVLSLNDIALSFSTVFWPPTAGGGLASFLHAVLFYKGKWATPRIEQ